MAAVCDIKDLQKLARRRVPRMFYEYADSGSWTQSTYRANETDFEDIKLRQRVAVDITERSVKTEMIGQSVAMPVAFMRAARSPPKLAANMSRKCPSMRSLNRPSARSVGITKPRTGPAAPPGRSTSRSSRRVLQSRP